MNRFLLATLFIFHFMIMPVSAFDFFVSFKEAKKGDYIVFSLNKTYTCISIFERSEKRLVLEEITCLKSKLPPKEAKNFFEKIENPASHTLMEIDLESKTCLTCYDVKNQSFIDSKTFDPFLIHLFNLDFRLLKSSERRKIGVPDITSSIDHRPVWNPRYYYEGVQIQGRSCEGYRAIIPETIKWIGGKYVEIYLDPSRSDFFFPVWIQISDDAAAFKLIPIDMGRNFSSQTQHFPRPLPHFIGGLSPLPDQLSFQFETVYPIDSHRFFYYETDQHQTHPANVLKIEKNRSDSYTLSITLPPKKGVDYVLFSTTIEQKEMVIESLQLCKIN